MRDMVGGSFFPTCQLERSQIHTFSHAALGIDMCTAHERQQLQIGNAELLLSALGR